MTVLSAQSIRKHIKIEPFDERNIHNESGTSLGLSSSSYDVTLAQDVTLYPLHVVIQHALARCDIKNMPMWSLASTEQYVEIPHNVSCMLLDKSTLARRGLAVQNTLIDPGFRGYITLELSNHGNEILELKKGQPIGQLLFAWLDEATEQPYNGKYQDQPNRPVEAIKEN